MKFQTDGSEAGSFLRVLPKYLQQLPSTSVFCLCSSYVVAEGVLMSCVQMNFSPFVFLLPFRMLQGSHSSSDKTSDGGPEFAEVFVIVWIGATVITLNSKLLGGQM